jgi:negative regulator of genetic competence, sporulation and motility
MKKIVIFFYFLAFLTSCSSDDVTSSNSTSVSGSWKIKSFIDNNNRDRTNNYTTYSFEFKSTGEIIVTSNSTKYNGTYATVMDSGKEKFNIVITTSDNTLAEINKDWILSEKTDTTMKFTKSSGGNGGTKTLIFGK